MLGRTTLTCLVVAAAALASEELLQTEPEALERTGVEKRFYSWEGAKRSLPAKRKFYAWAGKRDGAELGLEDHLAQGPDKRKFYAWAGKRSGSPEEVASAEEAVAKRKAFYAWAGKRSLEALSPAQQELELQKFNAWAGTDPSHHQQDKRK